MIWIFVIFSIISILIIGSNWFMAVRWWLFKERASMIPLIGGVSGVVAILTSGWSQAVIFCWLPLILDLGTLMIVAALFGHFFKVKK